MLLRNQSSFAGDHIQDDSVFAAEVAAAKVEATQQVIRSNKIKINILNQKSNSKSNLGQTAKILAEMLYQCSYTKSTE